MLGTEPRRSTVTRFLVPTWGKEEQQILAGFATGASFKDAIPALQRAVARDLVDGWTIRLTNLGRSALQVILEAMGLDHDDEVVIPSLICTGVAAGVIRSGAKPVFVDVDEQFNVRVDSVLEAASARVRAVVLPHLCGLWARDTEAIIEWAGRRGIYVIEDCAQAQGLAVDGRNAGTLGDAAIFSGHGGKILAGPGGGWLLTRNERIAETVSLRALGPEPAESVRTRVIEFARSYAPDIVRENDISPREPMRGGGRPGQGRQPDFDRVQPCGISGVEARLLLSQWDNVEKTIDLRTENAARWRTLLEPLSTFGVRWLPREHNVHTKMLLSFDGDVGLSTARKLRLALWTAGVETEDWYSPLHTRSPFRGFRRASLPVTEKLGRTAFSVPVRPNLTGDDWDRIEWAIGEVSPG